MKNTLEKYVLTITVYFLLIIHCTNNLWGFKFSSIFRTESMEDAMLQVQLLVPNFQTDAKVTAKLKHSEVLTVELESDLRLPEMTNSIQKVILKYGKFFNFHSKTKSMTRSPDVLQFQIKSKFRILEMAPFHSWVQGIWIELVTTQRKMMCNFKFN